MNHQELITAAALAQLRGSAQQACHLLKTMANEDRLLLLCHLIDAQRNVGELEQLTGIRQPTLSQQLGVLREEGVVTTRRAGKFIYYALASAEVLHLLQALYQVFCATPGTSRQRDV